jgi:ribosome maturation factor RimP
LQTLLAPTVEALGLELLGIEYLPQPGGSLVRLYIDADAKGVAEGKGVGIEECEAVSREVSAQLDVEDPITGNYTLEVSSPGLERPLFTPAHFARFVGESAKVGLKLPQDGRRRFTGRIISVTGETLLFEVEGAGDFEVQHDNIDKAKLAPNWAALGYAPQAPKGAAKPKQPKHNVGKKPSKSE